jgi:hypothetical protein
MSDRLLLHACTVQFISVRTVRRGAACLVGEANAHAKAQAPHDEHGHVVRAGLQQRAGQEGCAAAYHDALAADLAEEALA